MKKRAAADCGQALTELLIVLPLFMLLCLGMINLYRLLVLDWWAQQEARYLAFEKTWAPASLGNKPAAELADSRKVVRPKYVDRVAAVRKVDSSGGMAVLFNPPHSKHVSRSETNDLSLFEESKVREAEPRRLSLTAGAPRSLYRKEVNKGFDKAKPAIESGQRQVELDLSGPPFSGQPTAERYEGSPHALNELKRQYKTVHNHPVTGSWRAQAALEKSVDKALHTDSSGHFGYPTGFIFLKQISWPDTLSTMLFEGAMENVLSNDRDLIPPQVGNSNVSSFVEYSNSRAFMWHGKKDKRWKWNIKAGADFFLITEPWHIPRRESPLGPYRRLGEQTDSIRSASDEGVLRRRVEGLYLLPSDPGAMIDPLLQTKWLSPLKSLTNTAGTFIRLIKKIALEDNPLRWLLDHMAKLPIISSMKLAIPEWPAVRPDSYPGSVEIQNDLMTGSKRTFDNYIKEQKQYP